MLYLTVNDPMFNELSETEKNIMKWAALLHDICKLGRPKFEGKDHIHPFKGGLQVLLIFYREGIIKIKTEEQERVFQEIIELIKKSKTDVDSNWSDYFKNKGLKYCLYKHSHRYLSDIFLRLWEHIAPRGSFVDLVFRLVFFHQSLLGLNDIPAMVELTNEERLIYCDEKFFKLVRILMVNDSSSYMYVMDHDNKMDRCIGEFDYNSELMRGDWDAKYKLLKYHISISGK